MSKSKRVLKIVRQTLVILLITFIMSEGVLRIYSRLNPVFIFDDDSYNRFRVKPQSLDYDFRINSKGFKDVEFKAQKEANTFRILGIGDSFAYGVVPYQYNYYTLLEEDLKKSGKKVELINMGIIGIGPKDYLSLFVNEGLALKPDMVIISFFVGNDFTDTIPPKNNKHVYSYSYVYKLLKYLIDINTKLKEPLGLQSPHASLVYDDDKPTFDDDFFVKLEAGRSEIYRKGNGLFEHQFVEAVNYLKKIKEMCDSYDIGLAVVLIPDEVQVNKSLQRRVLQFKSSAAANADDFDFTLPNRMLGARLQEQGIQFCDLLNEFSRAGAQTVLYKPNDTHWNIAGNRLASEVIERDVFHLSIALTTESNASQP